MWHIWRSIISRATIYVDSLPGQWRHHVSMMATNTNAAADRTRSVARGDRKHVTPTHYRGADPSLSVPGKDGQSGASNSYSIRFNLTSIPKVSWKTAFFITSMPSCHFWLWFCIDRSLSVCYCLLSISYAGRV